MSTHSLFGRVVRGLAVVRNAMALPANAEGRTDPLVVIANTSVAPDGPIPDDFTIPRELSYRPNPMVPPACESLLGSNKAIGLAHKYTQETQQQYDLPPSETPNETPGAPQEDSQAAPTQPTNEPPFANEIPAGEEDGVEAAPGVDPVPDEAPIDYDLQAARAAQAYSYYYGGVSQYDENYAMSMSGGAMGTLDTLGTVGAASTASTASAAGVAGAGGGTGNAEAPPGEEEFAAPRSFISNVMDDSRRGNMPRDADGRALAHYLDLSTLDSHTARKKKNKIPKGFKTWKEYGEFKKKEKRARQVHDILEDKYPVEYLEKRRHHCVVCCIKKRKGRQVILNRSAQLPQITEMPGEDDAHVLA